MCFTKNRISYYILWMIEFQGAQIAATATFITSKSWASGRLYSIQAASFELLEISRWSQIFYIDVEVWSLTYRLAFGIFLLFFVEKKDASIQRFSVRSKKLLRNPKTVQSHFVSSWNVDRIDFAHFPPLKMPSPSHPKYLLLWSYSTMPFSYTSNLL